MSCLYNDVRGFVALTSDIEKMMKIIFVAMDSTNFPQYRIKSRTNAGIVDSLITRRH